MRSFVLLFLLAAACMLAATATLTNAQSTTNDFDNSYLWQQTWKELAVKDLYGADVGAMDTLVTVQCHSIGVSGSVGYLSLSKSGKLYGWAEEMCRERWGMGSTPKDLSSAVVGVATSAQQKTFSKLFGYGTDNLLLLTSDNKNLMIWSSARYYYDATEWSNAQFFYLVTDKTGGSPWPSADTLVHAVSNADLVMVLTSSGSLFKWFPDSTRGNSDASLLYPAQIDPAKAFSGAHVRRIALGSTFALALTDANPQMQSNVYIWNALTNEEPVGKMWTDPTTAPSVDSLAVYVDDYADRGIIVSQNSQDGEFAVVQNTTSTVALSSRFSDQSGLAHHIDVHQINCEFSFLCVAIDAHGDDHAFGPSSLLYVFQRNTSFEQSNGYVLAALPAAPKSLMTSNASGVDISLRGVAPTFSTARRTGLAALSADGLSVLLLGNEYQVFAKFSDSYYTSGVKGWLIFEGIATMVIYFLPFASSFIRLLVGLIMTLFTHRPALKTKYSQIIPGFSVSHWLAFIVQFVFFIWMFFSKIHTLILNYHYLSLTRTYPWSVDISQRVSLIFIILLPILFVFLTVVYLFFVRHEQRTRWADDKIRQDIHNVFCVIEGLLIFVASFVTAVLNILLIIIFTGVYWNPTILNAILGYTGADQSIAGASATQRRILNHVVGGQNVASEVILLLSLLIPGVIYTFSIEVIQWAKFRKSTREALYAKLEDDRHGSKSGMTRLHAL